MKVLDISLISDPLLNQLEAWKVGIGHSSYLHAPPTHVRNGQSLDNLVNTFTDICGEAIKRACPSRTIKAKHKPPWWNATLANL